MDNLSRFTCGVSGVFCQPKWSKVFFIVDEISQKKNMTCDDFQGGHQELRPNNGGCWYIIPGMCRLGHAERPDFSSGPKSTSFYRVRPRNSARVLYKPVTECFLFFRKSLDICSLQLSWIICPPGPANLRPMEIMAKLIICNVLAEHTARFYKT